MNCFKNDCPVKCSCKYNCLWSECATSTLRLMKGQYNLSRVTQLKGLMLACPLPPSLPLSLPPSTPLAPPSLPFSRRGAPSFRWLLGGLALWIMGPVLALLSHCSPKPRSPRQPTDTMISYGRPLPFSPQEVSNNEGG